MSRDPEKKAEGILRFLAESTDAMSPEERRATLREEGVHIEALHSRVEGLLNDYERHRRKRWRTTAQEELERAQKQFLSLSAQEMSREEMIQFIDSESARGAMGNPIQAFYRKHSGEEPSDDDLRSFVESILRKRALESGHDPEK